MNLFHNQNLRQIGYRSYDRALYKQTQKQTQTDITIFYISKYSCFQNVVNFDYVYKKCLLQKLRNFTKNPANFYLLKKFHRESVKNESARAKN